MIKHLRKDNIDVRKLPPALIKAPQLKQKGNYPNSISFANHGLYLPSGPDQNEEDIDHVINSMLKFERL